MGEQRLGSILISMKQIDRDTDNVRRDTFSGAQPSVNRARRPLAPPDWMKNALIGAAAGITIWCALLVLQVLPGVGTDTPGIVLCAVIGLAIGVSHWRGVLLVILQLAAAVVLVIALSPVSNTIARYWVRSDPQSHSPLDAVIVLSAGLNPDTTISSDALDHLIAGLEIVRSGQSRVLVTTTTQAIYPTGLVSSQVDQSRIVDLIRTGAEWIRTPPGASTHDEALQSAKLLLPKGLRHVAVVTSPMHSKRACRTFEAAGFLVLCRPARLREVGSLPVEPDPRGRLSIFGQWVYEVSAMTEYSIRGWLRANRIRVARLQPSAKEQMASGTLVRVIA